VADLETGTVFAGCRIEGVLGRGGMGVIYRATDLRLGRTVALKLIATEQAADPDVRERFEREARLTAAIEHPNVVPVYGAGEEDGHLYLIMRCVPGTDLDALLRDEGRLDPARAASIVGQVGDALDAAHAAGLVHRDVKPANVLLAGEHVYLSDFGITRVQAADTRITDDGRWIGTVDFMSPEHLRGEPTDARADVYALGCVLATALTGRPPFRRESVPATIAAHLHDPVPRPSETAGVPEAFDAVLARALAKDPDDRYPSAGDLGRAARAAALGRSSAVSRGSVATGAATPEQAEPTRTIPATSATAVIDPPAPTALVEPDRRRDPPRAAPRPASVRVQRGRRRRLATVASVAVLAIPTVLVISWASSDDTGSGPLDATEVQDVAEAFAQAYSDEDDAALRRVLTPGVRRVSPTQVQQGRSAVVAEYHRQFQADDIQRYTLSDLDATGGRVGRASGRYTVTRKGAAPVTGRIAFGVVRRDGHATIDLIATEPRAA
jgi:serine/threonine-protein kinase